MEEKIGVDNVKKGGDEDAILPGFRFHPTDEELVGFYLKRKVDKKPITFDLIKHIDIYKHDPWDLPSSIGGAIEEKEGYFFCRRGRKYKNSIRPNRVTASGFWKATGIDKPIFPVGKIHSSCIGLKKTLVYYRGSAGKGTKTDWMMHEFRLPVAINNAKIANFQEAEVWTLCRIFKREVSSRKRAGSDLKKLHSKQNNQTDSSSSVITCSNNSFGDINQLHGKSPDIETIWCTAARSHQFGHQVMGHLEFSSIPIFNGNDFSKEENWDELRPMVDFALDPSLRYNCW